MEGLKSYRDQLKNLRDQAAILSLEANSLSKFFDEEETSLNRKREAERLMELRSSILEQLKEENEREIYAKYGHSEARLAVSIEKLAARIFIKAFLKDKETKVLADSLLKGHPEKRPPFNNVLVYVGPQGIPDEVGVVSVSLAARKSNREENQVIDELKKRGYLLLGEKEFSALIEKMVSGVLEGKISLPVCGEKLLGAETSDEFKIEVKKVRIKLVSPGPGNS